MILLTRRYNLLLWTTFNTAVVYPWEKVLIIQDSNLNTRHVIYYIDILKNYKALHGSHLYFTVNQILKQNMLSDNLIIFVTRSKVG